MTGHIDRDELRTEAQGAIDDGSFDGPAWASRYLELNGELTQANRELDYWMTRAYAAEKEALGYEKRIQAVRDVLDQEAPDPDVATRVRADTIRRALDGDTTKWK
ncbi:hypothetical protein NLU66_16610 [Brachybacterium sp. NBEC-018]|uniref:hypothetical protein n=1 Tax=Brachybacterium sp. NBEC-018 TaxID=2996004 RepID=UPI00217541AA|nr:hypothetical protein [Brachybacterium sp. NBEC-018]UVY83810.1 hypothetical protein NLU66_16610 [Brachybacterium sp. NBEC-018]